MLTKQFLNSLASVILTEEMVKKWKTYKGLYTAATGVLKKMFFLYNMHNWAIN